MSSTTDWNEIDEIFQQVLEAPEASRAGLLDRLCEGRPLVRAEVESLLQAHEAATGFLTPPVELAAADVDQAAEVGATLGAYRLVQPIGRGGMGSVFLAERTDGAFTHRVAIKVMRGAIADRDAGRRFQAERQILATLKHRGIVTLIDGGTTPGGQPYLVMEHVEGQPITTWLTERQVPLEARLRLFRQVCSAVHVAHQHGVVHRDLKPANILVTAAGEPKVLDFGVAKLLERPGATETLTGLLPGPLTPNYASPEQLRGLPVTTASDVYSLGVLLFECVTGARPYETTGRPVDEVLRQVLDAPTVRPSAVADRLLRADAKALPYAAKRVRGDLDAIVLKAMHVDPAQRYASAEALSDDVARWLGGRPVLASEPSPGYVLRKLAARHRVAAVTIVVAVVGVLAALGIAVWQQRIAARERAAAERRFDEVRGLATALIFKLHDAVAPLPGSTEARKLIVGEALGYLDRLAAETSREDVRLELALGYKQVGRAQGDPQQANLGEREPALRSFARTVELLESLKASPTLGRKALFETSQTQRLIAQTLIALGRKDEALATSRSALANAEAALAMAPDDAEGRRLVASAHFSLAISTPDRPTRLQHWLAAEREFDALLARKPDDPDRMRNVALVNKYLGGFYQGEGNEADAERRYRRAMDLDERRLAAIGPTRQLQFDLAIDYANLASIVARAGRLPEALGHYERSVRMREKLVESDPKDVLARTTLARVLLSVAKVRYSLGDAPATARDAARALDFASPEGGGDQDARNLAARSLVVLARLDVDRGRRDRACERYAAMLRLTTREALASGESSEVAWLQRVEQALPGCPPVARAVASPDGPRPSR